MYITLEKLIPSHANCMQHVLRCWERQSDGTEYKKTLRRPGLRPDPAEGVYSAPANPLVGGRGWLSPPQEPHLPALSPSGLASPTPHSKISSDAVKHTYGDPPKIRPSHLAFQVTKGRRM